MLFTIFSIIIFDLDYFKDINDNYGGHPMGDKVLKEVSSIIKKSITRKTDTCARLGSEKFGLILPKTNSAGAVFVAEKIRRNLEESLSLIGLGIQTELIVGSDNVEKKRNQGLESRKITGSFGVCQYDQSLGFGIYKKADQLQYEAKNNGRNQVKV